jgi:hypothetical protein
MAPSDSVETVSATWDSGGHMNPLTVFVGSSTEGCDRGIVPRLAALLTKSDFKVLTREDHEGFAPGEYTLDSLLTIAKEIDLALFVFSKDDRVEIRGRTEFIPRDNGAARVRSVHVAPRPSACCRHPGGRRQVARRRQRVWESHDSRAVTIHAGMPRSISPWPNWRSDGRCSDTMRCSTLRNAPCTGCGDKATIIIVAQYTWPALSVCWSAVLLKDRLTGPLVVALLLGVVAVAVGASTAASSRGAIDTLPVVLLAAAVFGLYSTLLSGVGKPDAKALEAIALNGISPTVCRMCAGIARCVRLRSASSHRGWR